MDTTNDWVLREGLDVIASDGEKVGEVKDALGESFTVKEGWFFPKEHIIPSSVIASVDDSAVYLSVTKDQAQADDWTSAAASSSTAADTGWGAAPAVDETTAAGVYGDTVSGDGYAEATAVESEDLAAGTYDRDAATGDTGTIRVPLSEEELVATRQEVDRGTVRIERDVVTEQQSLDVPVTEEEVLVSRQVVDRDLAPGEDAFQEGTIEIPVRGEEVAVEKRARVTGELDIDKRATTRTERVTDTVRREEAHVVDETGAVVDDASTLGDHRPARQ